MNIKETLGVGKSFIIGMVHCLPLPGTVRYDGNLQKVYDQAVLDAKTLEGCGVDAIMVENMGDDPFAINLDQAQRAALAIATQMVRESVSIPVGVDATFCDYEAALSIAYVTGCQFVRIPVFVDTVEFYGGIIYPCARECMMYRKSLGAEDIMVLADIQVKYTNMLIPNIPIEQSASNSAVCGADAIIVTGSASGVETPLDLIKRVKRVVNVPVIAGSGVNPQNIKDQMQFIDGAIVGSSLKEGGDLSKPISAQLTNELLQAMK